jgi:hypothetical protein
LLGRRLTAGDFSNCPLNHKNFHRGSRLLRRRLRSAPQFPHQESGRRRGAR